jgi:hypothetical protein
MCLAWQRSDGRVDGTGGGTANVQKGMGHALNSIQYTGLVPHNHTQESTARGKGQGVRAIRQE